MRPLPKLLVFLNPYLSTDQYLQPCHVVQIDPLDPALHHPSRTPTGIRGYLGARIASAELVREGDKEFRAPRHERVWEFKRGPIEVTDTSFYRRAVADGDLIAGDEKTARICGVKLEDPEVVRNRSRVADGEDALWIVDLADKVEETTTAGDPE